VTEVEGIGALPVETRFSTEKRVERVTRTVEGVGPLAGATGTATGYEIHMGRSSATGEVARPLGPESAATDRALGTYLHGLFENDTVREAFVSTVFAAADVPRSTRRSRPAEDAGNDGRSPYDRAADLVAEHVDLAAAGLSDIA
jgi:adenosylcobyric acid synthase